MSQTTPKWVLKVKSKQLKQSSYPKIGIYSDFPNIGDVPYHHFLKDLNNKNKGKDRANNTSLESYFKSCGDKESSTADPIHAFDIFQSQSMEASPIPSSSLIRLGYLLYDSNLLSLSGKRNRIQMILDKLQKQENTLSFTDFKAIGLFGFVRRNTFKDLDQAIGYLQLFQEVPTKEALGHVIMGLCINEKPLDAYEVWKRYLSTFQYPQYKSMERLGLFLAILVSLAKIGYFKDFISLTKQNLMPQQFNMYSLMTLADHMCKFKTLSSFGLEKRFLSDYFLDALKKECNNNRQISPRVWIALFKLSKNLRMDLFHSSLLTLAKEVGVDFDLLHRAIKVDFLLDDLKVQEAHELYKRVFKSNAIAEDSIEFYWLLNKMIVSMCTVVAKDSTNKKVAGDILCLVNVYYVRLRNSKRHINDETYLSILQAYASVGNHRRCKSVLQNMKIRGLSIRAEHWCYLITAYCRCGSVIKANEVLQEMKLAKIKPNASIFHSIITTYLSQSQPNYIKAFLYLKQMPQLKLDIPGTLYKDFVKVFLKTKDLTNAKEWMRVLQEIGVVPTVDVFNMLMDLALEKKQFELVKQYYNTATQTFFILPNKQSRLYLFKAYCRSLDEANAIAFWNENEDMIADDEGALLSLLQMIYQSANGSSYISLLDLLGSKVSLIQQRDDGAAFEVYHIYLSCLVKSECLDHVDQFLCNHLAPKSTSTLLPKTVDMLLSCIAPRLSQIANQYLAKLDAASRQTFIGTAIQSDPQRLHDLVVRYLNFQKKRSNQERARGIKAASAS